MSFSSLPASGREDGGRGWMPRPGSRRTSPPNPLPEAGRGNRTNAPVVKDPRSTVIPLPRGPSSDLAEWVERFRKQRSRSPRILHVGNVGNNGYNNAKLLNRAGLDC